MSRRHKQSRDQKLIELTMSAGVAVGLLSTADTARTRAAHPCGAAKHTIECTSRALWHAVTPYFTGAAVGAGVGLLAGFLLVVTWKYMRGASSGPFARTPEVAVAGRHAIPERVRHEVWRRDRGTCVECGSRARLEFDHIIPVSRGGSNTVRNLEIRCERCNRSKGANTRGSDLKLYPSAASGSVTAGRSTAMRG